MREDHDKALVVAAGGSGLLIGASIALRIPTEVLFAPDIAGDVAISDNSGITTLSGPTELYAPNATTHSLLDKADIGVQIDLQQFEPAIGSLQQYAPLLADFQTAVATPVGKALALRLAEGATFGSLAGSAIALGGLKLLSMYRQNKALLAENQEIESQKQIEIDPQLPEIFIQPENRFNRMRRFGRGKRLATVFAAIACTGIYALGESKSLSSSAPRTMTALAPSLADKYPAELKGAKISTDPIGRAVNTGAHEIPIFLENSESHGQKAAKNFVNAWDIFAEKENIDFSVDNPNEKRILHFSDIHCSDFFTENMLDPVLRKTRPSIIVISGDVYIHADTIPYEKNCFADLIKKVRKIDKEYGTHTDIVFVRGNHDPHDPVKGVVNLDDKHPIAKLQGLTFVGRPDPATTYGWKPTTPAKKIDLEKAITEQGDKLAETACEITRKTGVPPHVAITHRQQALDQTIAEGCAMIGISGHKHHNGRLKSIEVAGLNTSVLQHTAGSAAGADANGIPKVGTPQLDATFTLMPYNIVTGNFEDFFTPVISASGSAKILKQKIPAIP